MASLVAGMLAVVAWVGGGGQQALPPPPAPQPWTGEAAATHAAFAREKVDARWAEAAGARLWHRYFPVGGAQLAALYVACHASLCEVGGYSAVGPGVAQRKRMAAELRWPAFRGSVPGLHAEVTELSTTGEGATYRVIFRAIWRRTAG